MKVRFKQFTPELNALISERTNLRGSLNRLEHGSDDTPRTWFYETKSPKWILNTLTTKLDGMQDLESVKDYDLSKSDKFGPQGNAAPLKDRLETFNEYFEHLDSPEIIRDPVWQEAKREAVRRLGFNESGSPVTAEQVTQRGLAENKYDTSSGYPLYLKRKTPEAIEHAIANVEQSIDDRYPSTLGARASMGKTGESARHIFMASMATNVSGQRFQQPLQDYIRARKLDFFLPWEGWDSVQAAISQSWDTTSLKFSADYTKMDQHFNKHHGLEVFDVVKHYFKKEYWNRLRDIIVNVFTLPIITNLGMVDQEHAMPSGSEWTNFLETLWNYIFTIYLELKYQLKFKLRMGIGDDQLWVILGKWGPKGIQWILNIVMHEFERAGLPGNPEKQLVSTDSWEFLQRYGTDSWNGNDGQTRAAGVYSLIRNVTSQVFPEFLIRLKKSDPQWSDLFPIRVIQIAENAKHHPLFGWYMREFVAKSNENILQWVRKSRLEQEKLWSYAKKLQHLVPSYVGAYSVDRPIWEYDSFKELAQVA